ASGRIWLADGKNVVFGSAVYPDCKDGACNKQSGEEVKKSKVKAKIFSRLFFRRWNAFTEFKRSHLFAQSVEAPVSAAGSGTAAGTAATTSKDLTPGDHDVPPFSLGGQDMYTISPDGQEVAYTSNIDELEAISTNDEIFVVPINGGNAKKISTSPGADTTPLYSPDGKYLAWRSQARAGFEADKWRLIVQDRQAGKTRDLTAKFDRSPGSCAGAPTASAICFAGEDHGEAPIYSVGFESDQPAEIARLYADDLIFGTNGALYFTRMSIAAPNEIWRLVFTDLALSNSR